MHFFRVIIMSGVFFIGAQAQYSIEISVLNTTDRKLFVVYRSQENACKPFRMPILGNEKKVLKIKVSPDCTLADQPEFIMFINKEKTRLPIMQAIKKSKKGVWQGYPLYTILEHDGSYVAEMSYYMVKGKP